MFQAKRTALAREILREDINQRQLRREKTAANVSCYEAQNTASRVINGASGPTGVSSASARNLKSEKRNEAKPPADASVPTIQARYLCSGHERGTSRADVFQAVTFADCARQTRWTRAGAAVNWLVLASKSDAEPAL